MGNVRSTGPSSRNAGDLLAEFKSTGGQEAFEEIVRRYAAMVFGVCLKTTRNAHDAEDATQAVFLTLAVQIKTDKAQISYVGPWLQEVARRTSLDIRRSKKRRENREEVHAASNGNGDGLHHDDGSAALDVEEMKAVLNEELNQLPAKYRLPLVSLYFGGMNRQDVAKELGCTPEALSVRVHRGRQMLGRRLTARGVVVGLLLGITIGIVGALAAGLRPDDRLLAVPVAALLLASAILGAALGAVVGSFVGLSVSRQSPGGL